MLTMSSWLFLRLSETYRYHLGKALVYPSC